MKAEGGWAGDLHRVLARRPRLRRVALHLGAALGRGRPRESRPHGGRGPRARLARRPRADPFGRPRPERGDALAGRRALPARGRLPPDHRPQGDGAGRHPASPGGLGAGRAAGTLGRLRHRLRLRRPQLPADAVPFAVLQQAHRRVRRLSRKPRPHVARDAGARPGGDRRRVRDRRADRRRPDTRDRGRRRARVRPARRSPRRSLGRQRRLDPRMVDRLRSLALLQGGLPARVDRPGTRGHRKTHCRRLEADEPRPDGRDRPFRRLGPDRRGPPVDRRSLSPEEDRGRPLRRGARVHGLEHVHREGRHADAPRLHPERDRRRGVPPRLAPGAVRARRQPRPGRPDRRSRARRNGVRDRARQTRLPASAPRRGGGGARRLHAVDPAAPGPRRVGPRGQLATGAARPAEERRGADRDTAFDRRRARLRRRARRRRHGLALGPRRTERLHARADPRRRRGPPARAHARADHGRGQAAAG